MSCAREAIADAPRHVIAARGQDKDRCTHGTLGKPAAPIASVSHHHTHELAVNVLKVLYITPLLIILRSRGGLCCSPRAPHTSGTRCGAARGSLSHAIRTLQSYVAHSRPQRHHAGHRGRAPSLDDDLGGRDGGPHRHARPSPNGRSLPGILNLR